MSIVLVVAPHPDDETLGCAGTLLRHRGEGDEIHWLIMTTISKESGFSQEQISKRKNEINTVASIYDFKSVHQEKYITSRLDVVPMSGLIEKVSLVINNIKPDIIYVPFRNDAHSDHRVTFDAVISCTKSFRYPFISKVRAYETLSETEFNIRPDYSSFKPNLWVNINEYLEKKIEIMKSYESEMDDHPFPRSEQNIRALAILRGATAGFEAAESFVSLKEVI